MEFPQTESNPETAAAASGHSFFGKSLHPKILHPGILYRAILITLAASVAICGTLAAAQQDRPEITPGERKAPRKKEAEPRAVALLNLSSDGKVSLVPIAILVNGKFWDASAYKAAPVPMALEPGTVYEAERDGSSIGLFTVSTALHSKAANASVPWLGTGAWAPAGSETEKKPALHAETAPVGIDNGDAPPRLTKNPAAATNSAPATPASTSSSSTPSSSTPSSSPSQSGSGDEPPRLKRPADQSSTPSNSPQSSSPNQPGSSQTGSGSGSTGSTSTGSTTSPTSSQSGSKPSDSNSDKTKSDAKSTERSDVASSDSGAAEANRPRLRRGKPATSFADEDIPGYSKIDAASPPVHGIPPSATAVTTQPAATPAPATVQTIPAISDSAGPTPHSYGFEWLKDEEGERRQQLITLAQDQVRAYVDAQAKATISPKSAPTPHRVSTKKPAAPALSEVQMTTFDLWSMNQPIMVFSATAQIPPSQSAAQTTGSTPAPDLQYSIVLVAYPDIYHNLHKLYVGVTDKYHLDLTPRLELIDAVDADGDGRGELLFREVSDAGTGWVIYRATADKLWKMYDSLNPE
jgi:hypothetical protein